MSRYVPEPGATAQHENSWETVEGATEMLIKEWSEYLQISQGPGRQAEGNDEITLDASNLAAEHMDQLDEDRIIEKWADDVPDAIKSEVAARLRRDADPDLVKLLDKYGKQFRSLPAA